MTRLVPTTVVLLVISGLLTAPLQAQICLDFVFFCDGLELQVDGDIITGTWRNALGCNGGGDVPVVGIIKNGLPLPCHAGPTKRRDNPQKPAKAGIVCLPEWGTCPFNWEWYFLLDGLDDGTLDLGETSGVLPPPGSCAFDDMHYELLLGPCPFGEEAGGIASSEWLRQGRSLRETAEMLGESGR